MWAVYQLEWDDVCKILCFDPTKHNGLTTISFKNWDLPFPYFCVTSLMTVTLGASRMWVLLHKYKPKKNKTKICFYSVWRLQDSESQGITSKWDIPLQCYGTFDLPDQSDPLANVGSVEWTAPAWPGTRRRSWRRSSECRSGTEVSQSSGRPTHRTVFGTAQA